ncbi:MAG TPA: aromatic-ring-hydroxylating dioxygenase subunit beta [Acidimicrobiales bacterium]|nr:aromatic-ring-hydroxylating dioxygenase subunit beta [Acidimicrobiales bacterium]
MAIATLAALDEVTRPVVEEFLYDEAELLSAWRWDDWLALFVPGARYEVPTFDVDGHSGREAQYFIADDWDLLQARITRMKSKNAHAENPPSHTHRLISNVRLALEGDELAVRANFIVHRMRDGLLDPYVGRYEHRLVLVDGRLRFALRRAVLLTEAVRPGTRLSFIL